MIIGSSQQNIGYKTYQVGIGCVRKIELGCLVTRRIDKEWIQLKYGVSNGPATFASGEPLPVVTELVGYYFKLAKRTRRIQVMQALREREPGKRKFAEFRNQRWQAKISTSWFSHFSIAICVTHGFSHFSMSATGFRVAPRKPKLCERRSGTPQMAMSYFLGNNSYNPN